MRFYYPLIGLLATIFSFQTILAQGVAINLDASKLTQEIDAKLSEAQRKGSVERASISIPWFENEQLTLELEEASQFAPALQAQYPEIRSYRVATPDGIRHGRLNTSPRGVFMVLLGGDGPVGILHENDQLIPSHRLERIDIDAQLGAVACEVEDDVKEHNHDHAERSQVNSCFQFGATLRQFRMALACTGEFATNNGGSVASVNAAYNNRLAEINVIYEVDAAVSFVLIPGNDVLINFNASTDPYSNPSNSFTSLDEGEIYIEGLINDADYDIGHSVHDVVGGGSASGRAGLGVVCVTGAKARGWSTLFNGFSLAIIQHEIGHQFNCQHTNFGCNSTGAQRYEVGRGNTIMNPGTIPDCIGANAVNTINPISSIYLHVGSIVALENHISTTGSCFTSVSTGNGAPSSDASAASGNTIPANTPFILEGGGSDPEGASLTYCWEQFDTDGTSTGIPTATANSTVAPLFRSNFPTSDPNRYLPNLNTILSGVASDGSDGELLTNVSRTMTFRLTTRDGTTGNACDETSVSVVNTGAPFQITSQNTATTLTANGSNTATVTWDVAGTTANGINAANVDILFSDNGGSTFSFTIAAATPNDGSHTFIIPAFATSSGRIMIRGTGNIFLDINDAPITINVGGGCAAREVSISPAAPVTAPAGDASLDLSLSPDFGNQLSNPFTFVIDGSGLSGQSVLENADNPGIDCTTRNFVGSHEIQPVFAGSNASYNFSSNASNTAGQFFQSATLFENGFQGDCTDYLGATLATTAANNVSSVSYSTTLNTSSIYDLVGFGIGSGTGSINVTFTGGNLFDGPPNPGAGFFYTYGIVDEGTGNISAFDPLADLSNATNFPAGTYTVFGASVENGTNVNSFVGGTKAAFVNAAALQSICARVSSNDIMVTITGAPLPVELISFSGSAKDYGNHLTWASASEIGTEFYQIERLDGAKWNAIGTVATNGVASEYDFTDAETADGRYYYRLAMFEGDGSIDYSSTISILRNANEKEALKVFPNPSTSGGFTLQWSAKKQANNVQIFDALGRLSKAYVITNQNTPSLQIQSGLAPGTYTMTILYATRETETVRIVVVP